MSEEREQQEELVVTRDRMGYRFGIYISIIIAFTICFCVCQARGCNEADNKAIVEVSKNGVKFKVVGPTGPGKLRVEAEK